MSFDRLQARCSFCGRRPPEVRRMVAGPGAAYICDACLQLCEEILQDTTPFSAKALELASRPPVVVAVPGEPEVPTRPRNPLRSVMIELEQKRQGMTLILHEMQFYKSHFELHYLWMRPPFMAGFAFVLRRSAPGLVFTAPGLIASPQALTASPTARTFFAALMSRS